MPIKSVLLQPSAWLVRDEPTGILLWAPTTGAPSMLAALDSDAANCVNSTGLAQDSDSLDARAFVTSGGSLPTFEADARDASLTISCWMQSNDGRTASPAIIVFDKDDFSKAELLSPYATVNTGHFYDRASFIGSMTDIFSLLTLGRFAVACVFPSRPLDPANGCASFQLNAVNATITYAYGPDTTPDPFAFADKVGAVGTVVQSDTLAIVGFTGTQAVAITGDASAQLRVNAGAWVTSGTINPGDTLTLRMTAGPANGDVRASIVTVETRADAWNVTAGTDTPVNLNPPANRVNVMPGVYIPSAAVADGPVFWQPRGNTIPMVFTFAASPWPVQWSTGAGGPWTDGAISGTVPVNGNIYIRVKTPPGPAQVASVRLTYTAANLTSDVTLTTGAEAFVYSVDLSPVDTFQDNSVPPVNVAWAPVANGSARHVSVASPRSRVLNSAVADWFTNLEVGQIFRLSDGARMAFPPGSIVAGIGYGGRRNLSESSNTVGRAQCLYYLRNLPASAFDLLPLVDTALDDLVVILQDPPGIIPTGWDALSLMDAVNNDTVRLARRARLNGAGFTTIADSYDIRLRVYFRVVKPPEGMTWEI